MTRKLSLGSLSRLWRRRHPETHLTDEEQRYEAAYINWQLEQQFLREGGGISGLRK